MHIRKSQKHGAAIIRLNILNSVGNAMGEKMNYKIFIEKTDEILSNMSMEELQNCVHAIARKTPEGKRDEFIQMLDSCYNKEIGKENAEKPMYIRRMKDEMVRDKLLHINNVFTKIRDGELFISASGYEDYSNGYWSSEWIWEYEDSNGIGRSN
jgi:predicted RNA-binding protein